MSYVAKESADMIIWLEKKLIYFYKLIFRENNLPLAHTTKWNPNLVLKNPQIWKDWNPNAIVPRPQLATLTGVHNPKIDYQLTIQRQLTANCRETHMKVWSRHGYRVT